MILAGIDEAGYGPLLGPLVVGCCAFELRAPDAPAEATAQWPCLWSKLKKVVGKSRCRRGQKLHINDSKQVYSPSAGLRELERSVLAAAGAWGDWPEDLDALLRRIAPDAPVLLDEHPWYSNTVQPLPLHGARDAVRISANALRSQAERVGVRGVHLAARILPERALNRMLDQTRNKSAALFSVVACHLDQLMRRFDAQDLTIVCDRQGGRARYGSLLRLMFPDRALEVTRECERHSEYRLSATSAGHVVRLVFCEKAEGQCLPVALASMLSKYLREALMERLNRWWQAHLPELAPTAGYYTDGKRFLRDIQAKREELGIDDALLVRSR